MSNNLIAQTLSKYLPEPAVPVCTNWIVQLNIHLRITKSRASKYGDYRPVRGSDAHIITVNHNLNKYSFMITFIHEVAHLVCEKKYSRFISPHGREWKSEYSILLNYFLSKNIFPADIERALSQYVKNPAASSCTDENLLRVLKNYDAHEKEKVVYLEDLPQGTIFRLNSSKMKFVKGELMRKRFQCFEIQSKAEYRVSGLAEVVIDQQEAAAVSSDNPKLSGFNFFD